VSEQRIRRLKNDHEHLSRELEGNDFIKVVVAKGDPPTQYTIAYDIKGVTFDPSKGQISYITHHELEIILLTEYPLSPPYCKMKTEIFHPNMSPSEIRLGDEGTWSATKSILDIVKQIGCMISYQDYDLNAPLNKEAAKWAKKNESVLPLDSIDFFAQDASEGEPQTQLKHEVQAKAFCAYCLDPDPNNTCNNGHPACDDCLSSCEYCDNITCLACTDNTCGECREKIEAHCSEIDTAIEQGNIGQSVSLAKNALENFNYVPKLMESLDKIERIKKTIAYIETCRKSYCFHGIVTACEELRSLGLENEALAKIEDAASDKLNAADASVANGKKELQVNHNPELACEYFSNALQIVPDHPSAYKLLEEAKTRRDKARKYVGFAQERLDKGQYDRALEDAKKAISLDSSLGSKAKELIDAASHLQVSEQRKKKKRLLAFLATGGILILSSLIFFYVWEDKRLKAEYELFLGELESEPTVEAKVEALSVYVISHRKSRFTKDAQKRTNDLYTFIQEREFEIAKRNANIMLKNKDYDKAETVYQQYLSQNPDTTYAAELNENISKVRNLADDKDYETLRWLSKCNPRTRIGAYTSYIANHPNGKHREEVTQLIANTGEDYYKYFKEEIALLKSNRNWDKCIDTCNEFDENMDDSIWTDEVEQLRVECRKRLDEERDVAALMVEANAKGEDYVAAKQIYQRYVEANPDASVRTSIRKKIDILDEKLRNRNEWEEILAYIKSEEDDLGERISRLKKYVTQNPSGEHLEEATQEMKVLEERRDIVSWKKTAESCADAQISIERKIGLLKGFLQRNVSGKYISDAKAKLSALKREQASRSWEDVARYCDNQETEISDRISKLRLFINQNPTGEFVQDAQLILGKLRRFLEEEKRIRHRIAEIGNTYVYHNGTITDIRTGFMWCAFDSYLDLQKCLKHQSATTYVKRIRYGGYTDWRLPSEEALRSIYNNKPFFPTANEAKWYWTSNLGSGHMVPVVTTERQTGWRMEQIELDIGCGSVRAVRGP
jgi:ubiquitin-protein ligase/peptide methionine sulfoxide reductase MsrA